MNAENLSEKPNLSKQKSLLTPEQEELIKQERHWLADLQVILGKLGTSAEEQNTLTQSIQQLDELFLVVVVGEFNAGKSAFINALLGQKLLKEGVTPTTAQINVLRYGETSKRNIQHAELTILMEPIDILRHLNIVDTPGTNAIIREHQQITEEFVPRSDMVLFITSADRPFTESERNFLAHIRDWGKKVVVIINKIDIFETEEDLEQVLTFVRDHVPDLLGKKSRAEIFPISGRLALKAKQGQEELWPKSRFAPLEKYIYDTLDQKTRLRLKLLNPLGVGDRLIKKYDKITKNRLELLSKDLETLSNVERQLKIYREDMIRDFEFRISDIEKLLFDMEKRGNEYFDEVMRLSRVFDLIKKKQIKQGFELKVVSNVPQAIDSKVNELVDWLVNTDLQQWKNVTDYLKQRKEADKEQIIGEVGQNFRYDRERLIDSVGRSAQQVVQTYDKSDEARKIASGAQNAVAGTAIAEIGAISLGAIVTAMTTTLAIDVTGLLAASIVAMLGLFVIPNQRESSKKQLSNKVAELRIHLVNSLTTQFKKELHLSIQRINEAVAPYTRFVRAERDNLQATQEELEEAKRMQSRLRAQIEALNEE